MKIEATGNTQEDAEALLNQKREAITAKVENVAFSDVIKYGNFEIGWKYVQDYELVI